MTSAENNGTEAAPLKVELHLAAAQSRDAFDIWHAALADMFDVALKPDAPTFRGDVIGFHLGDCLTFNNASVGQRLERSAALARRSGLDHVMIAYQTRGSLRGDYDGRSVNLRPGDVAFLDFARPTVSSEDDFSRITLIFPRERLPVSLRGRDLHGLVLNRSQASTRLLALYMRALWRSAASLSLPQACAAVNTAFALAAQSWTSRGFGAEEEATPALRLMAGLYLDPEAVAADLGLSRSTLYRLFAGEGGVRSQILMRRLDRCFAALLEPRMQATAIGDIAFVQGFNSEAHFSRAFRQRFGIAARDLRFMARQRAAARTRQSDEAAPTTMRDWLRELGAAESAGS